MQKSREDIINTIIGNIDNTYKYTRGNLQLLQLQPTKNLQQLATKITKNDNVDFSVVINTKILK